MTDSYLGVPAPAQENLILAYNMTILDGFHKFFGLVAQYECSGSGTFCNTQINYDNISEACYST
jgi:hypothetical protein